jgi:glycosyltransferase involved in cell wall biosynthesis
MKIEHPILSVLIITHNQKDELCRCVESVLAQKITFPYEIIISDDRSQDGTFELAQEYQANYPSIIKATQCNSDECNPANNSQRSGWNRCHAHQEAKGKYIVHIDGDDYIKDGSKVYQQQVEMLEQHPECSACMQNVLVVRNNETDTGKPWLEASKHTQGRIYTPKEYILQQIFNFHTAFVFRNQKHINPTAVYGKRYVDTVITYHYMQFGNIICVDACDYMYIKNNESISNSMAINDRKVLWCIAIYIPLLIPSLTGYFLQSYAKDILLLVNEIRKGLTISSSAIVSLEGLQAFIYSCLKKEPRSLLSIVRLQLCRILLLFILKFKIKLSIFTRLLYYLLIGQKQSSDVKFK